VTDRSNDRGGIPFKLLLQTLKEGGFDFKNCDVLPGLRIDPSDPEWADFFAEEAMSNDPAVPAVPEGRPLQRPSATEDQAVRPIPSTVLPPVGGSGGSRGGVIPAREAEPGARSRVAPAAGPVPQAGTPLPEGAIAAREAARWLRQRREVEAQAGREPKPLSRDEPRTSEGIHPEVQKTGTEWSDDKFYDTLKTRQFSDAEIQAWAGGSEGAAAAKAAARFLFERAAAHVPTATGPNVAARIASLGEVESRLRPAQRAAARGRTINTPVESASDASAPVADTGRDRIIPRRRMWIWIGFALFLIVGVVPPWTRTLRYEGQILSTNPAGHYLLFDPPIGKRESFAFVSYAIDVPRLVLLWVLVVVVTIGGAYLTTPTRPRESTD